MGGRDVDEGEESLKGREKRGIYWRGEEREARDERDGVRGWRAEGGENVRERGKALLEIL